MPVHPNGKTPTETNSTSSKMTNREQQKFKKKEPDQSSTVVEKVNTPFPPVIDRISRKNSVQIQKILKLKSTWSNKGLYNNSFSSDCIFFLCA